MPIGIKNAKTEVSFVRDLPDGRSSTG